MLRPPSLHRKLDPARFPNMSTQMAAIVGYLLDRPCTDPVIAELVLTPDGAVLARLEGETRTRAFIGAVADLRANLRRLAIAAELSGEEWAAFVSVVKERLGLALDHEG